MKTLKVTMFPLNLLLTSNIHFRFSQCRFIHHLNKYICDKTLLFTTNLHQVSNVYRGGLYKGFITRSFFYENEEKRKNEKEKKQKLTVACCHIYLTATRIKNKNNIVIKTNNKY